MGPLERGIEVFNLWKVSLLWEGLQGVFYLILQLWLFQDFFITPLTNEIIFKVKCAIFYSQPENIKSAKR